MEADELQYIQDLENQNMMLNQQQSNKLSSSIFSGINDPNLIQWQLELDNILERIDHLLRGHELGFDEKGNLTWNEPTNIDNKLFNEYGVQEILRILSMYLNRNTILSNYDEDTINLKVYDFGMEIVDLVFMKYEEMFFLKSDKQHFEVLIREYYRKLERLRMNDKIAYKIELLRIKEEIKTRKKDELDSKIKLYPMRIRELIDTVHSAYLRAMNGGERESLRTARTVNQTEPLRQPQGLQNPQSTGGFTLNPFKWGKR
jgi:hypothetical protein